MAIMLETLIVPCASVVSSASLTPVAGASISRCSSIRFSQFRGLKILQNRRGAFVSSTSKSASHGVEESFVKLGKLHLKVLRAILTSQLIILSNGVAGVTDATWKSLVLESDLPVLVEFWAPWCGPCRMMHPLIDKLAKQYAGKLNCYKVNTDESPSIATQYSIRSIPTVIIFKNGEKKDAVVGAVPESTLTTSIEKFL